MNENPELTGGLRLGLAAGSITRDPATGLLTIEEEGRGLALGLVAVTPSGDSIGPLRISLGVAAPVLSGVVLADQAYVQGTGAQSYNAAVAFSGAALVYALSPAVAGVSIAATGVVTVSTTAVLALTQVTVRASNASGSVERAFRISVAVAAPVLSGVAIPNQLNLIRGSAASTIAAAPAFTGTVTNYLITGAGVSIHATTGVITIARTVSRPVQTVTVRASNAGGFAETSFQMSVVMAALDLAQVTLTIRTDPTGDSITGVPAGFATWTVDLTNPPAGLTALWWRGDPHVEGAGPGTGYHPMIRHPTLANRWIARAVTPTTGAPRIQAFLYVNDPVNANYNRLGESVTHHFIYSTDSVQLNPLTEMTFSGPTAALVQTLQLYVENSVPVSRILPLVNASEYARLGQGYVSGDGLQQIVAVGQCEAHPEVIVLGQDSGSLWKTVDFGRSWRRPTKRGLFAQNTWGVAIDPVDPDRVFVYGGGLYDSSVAGLYLSTDGCETFQPRKVDGSSLTGDIGEYNGIAHAPGSIGASRAEKWFCILCSKDTVNAVCARSVNGGDSWNSVGNIWGTARGNVIALVGDPSNQNTFWASSDTGLYKITNVFSGTPVVTQVPVVGGNASADIVTKVVISANGQTIKAAVPGQGIYLSTNGGTSFTRQGSFSNFQKGFISPWDTDFIVTTKEISSSSSRPYATTNGATFTQPADSAIEKRPGVNGTARMCHARNHVLFHSGHATWALLVGRQSELFTGNNHYRTTDGGASWDLSNTGYNGSNFKILGQCPAVFSINDKNKMGLPFYDISARFSLDGFRTILTAGDAKSAAIASGMPSGTNAVPAIGAAVHPGAGKQILLQVLGPYDNLSYLIRSDDHGASWDPVYTNFSGVKVGGIFYNYADPGKVMWYNRRSIDGNWATWSGVMSGLDSSDAVCAHTCKLSGTNAFFTSSIASGDGRVIKRSTDNGASWSQVLSLSYSIMGALRYASMAVHPFDADIVYVRDTTKYRIRKYDLSVSSTSPVATLNLFGAAGATQNSSLYPRPMEIGHIAIDPRFPDVMYVTCKGAGQSNLWRSTNGGASWEALDAHAGLIAKNGIAVHPLTGDLIVGGDNGSHVIPPPYAQAGTLFSQLSYDNYVGVA